MPLCQCADESEEGDGGEDDAVHDELKLPGVGYQLEK